MAFLKSELMEPCSITNSQHPVLHSNGKEVKEPPNHDKAGTLEAMVLGLSKNRHEASLIEQGRATSEQMTATLKTCKIGPSPTGNALCQVLRRDQDKHGPQTFGASPTYQTH